VKLTACASLSLTPEKRTWYRAINPKHAPNFVSATHTKNVASRFSPGPNTLRPFEILYFSESHQVALYEVEALLGSIHKGVTLPNPNQSWLVINVDVLLHSITDLTDVASLRRLGTNAQELTGDWSGYELRAKSGSVRGSVRAAPTQDLGEALFSTPQIEGFRAISSKIPTQMNPVVFPEKLLPGSKIIYTDHTGKTYVVP
jgi:hypothetical protein